MEPSGNTLSTIPERTILCRLLIWWDPGWRWDLGRGKLYKSEWVLRVGDPIPEIPSVLAERQAG